MLFRLAAMLGQPNPYAMADSIPLPVMLQWMEFLAQEPLGVWGQVLEQVLGGKSKPIPTMSEDQIAQGLDRLLALGIGRKGNASEKPGNPVSR